MKIKEILDKKEEGGESQPETIELEKPQKIERKEESPDRFIKINLTLESVNRQHKKVDQLIDKLITSLDSATEENVMVLGKSSTLMINEISSDLEKFYRQSQSLQDEDFNQKVGINKELKDKILFYSKITTFENFEKDKQNLQQQINKIEELDLKAQQKQEDLKKQKDEIEIKRNSFLETVSKERNKSQSGINGVYNKFFKKDNIKNIDNVESIFLNKEKEAEEGKDVDVYVLGMNKFIDLKNLFKEYFLLKNDYNKEKKDSVLNYPKTQRNLLLEDIRREKEAFVLFKRKFNDNFKYIDNYIVPAINKAEQMAINEQKRLNFLKSNIQERIIGEEPESFESENEKISWKNISDSIKRFVWYISRAKDIDKEIILEELKKEVELTKESAHIAFCTNENTLEKILEDNKIITIWDMGEKEQSDHVKQRTTTNGYIDRRMSLERKIGIADKPYVSCFISNSKSERKPPEQYGNCLIIFKDEIKDKETVYMEGDSMSASYPIKKYIEYEEDSNVHSSNQRQEEALPGNSDNPNKTNNPNYRKLTENHAIVADAMFNILNKYEDTLKESIPSATGIGMEIPKINMHLTYVETLVPQEKLKRDKIKEIIIKGKPSNTIIELAQKYNIPIINEIS